MVGKKLADPTWTRDFHLYKYCPSRMYWTCMVLGDLLRFLPRWSSKLQIPKSSKVICWWLNIGQTKKLVSYCTEEARRIQIHVQSVYIKSGCRSPNSIQAFNPPSSPLSVVTYFSSSFARTPGRFLTLFLHDKYVILTRQPTTIRMELLKN